MADVGRVAPLHPVIAGLFEELPKPETMWARDGRMKWLKACAACFAVLYRGEGEVIISAQDNLQAAPTPKEPSEKENEGG